MRIINNVCKGIKEFDHIVAGKTIEKDSKIWLGFLVDGSDFIAGKDTGADVIIEFKNDEDVKTMIELLKEELND